MGTLPDLNYTLNDRDFISFSYLFKNFQFKSVFGDRANFRFNGVVVPAFHANRSKNMNQLYFKYHNSNRDFMVGIETQNEND